MDDDVARIGRTSLLLRTRVARGLTGIERLGQPEFLHPSGSIEDRATWPLVRDGVDRGDR
ncbi:MAG: hypothetical protein ACYCPN_00120 [Thermoplasmata archaeon]